MIETVKRIVCDRCGKTSVAALESEDPRDIARDDEGRFRVNIGYLDLYGTEHPDMNHKCAEFLDEYDEGDLCVKCFIELCEDN